MSTFEPTAEQVSIIDAYAAGDHLVIEAGAGTGKTATLKLLAENSPQRHGVYVAYNRSIANEANRSFPRSVTCRTAHSFAFGAVGWRFKHRINGPRIGAELAADILGLHDPIQIGETTLPRTMLARLVGETISRFCHAADEEIGRRHVPLHLPLVGRVDARFKTELIEYLLPVARRAWHEDITRTDGRLRFTHDHYLKMWTLSRPQLPGDYVLLDEAQDSNGCIAGLMDDQRAQRIWVGDPSQAIYGWRGAVNAMKHAPGKRLFLTQSFRFGDAIAAEANKWLSLLSAPLRLTGYDRIASSVGSLEEPDAILCRTNLEAISQAMAAMREGRRPALVGGGREIRRMAEAAEDLQQGNPTSHPELFAFTSWSEVCEYVEAEPDGSDLRTLVQLINQYGPRELIRVIDQLADERAADLIVSTAHKAKGRQWARVRIANDFQQPKPDDDGRLAEPAREECMLAYVAVTRARERLDPGGLAWVDRYLEDWEEADIWECGDLSEE